ncbi:MAG: ATP synthase F1 subunit delta [Bacteroidetes bacterium GWF2_33_16]|nr:MAG: ATP synthase F1 subunit delta [Bacteroidetes bacterium GWE2_32_14]OFY04755.1 MAG: ATP synthase F1 subunit delta [Bacteroidetes bacterium GWF2_33_16]
MYQSQITVRYAKALFLLASEKNKLEEVKNDIVLIYDTLKLSSDLNTLLKHPVIKSSEKVKALTNLFGSQIDPITLTFLELIINNKREAYIERMFQNFINIYKKSKDINIAVLTTALELTNEEKTTILRNIESKTKSTIELNQIVDESIIGGFILQIGDKEIDVSVLKQLQRFKESLIDIDLNVKKKKN